ncbi:MAG: protein-(glutamine-N5) methyltransferase, release factor-specific, partial [Candidatus Eremiobacteraeota bacterium]|nr:protein-(glutamine-N5) methyltransferase, release factor-specific [Candidatus Eremiobacteraeota bacterium]
GAGGDRAFACVVANLPYVPSSEVPLPPHPVGFEPRIALDGGPDGLGVYRRLLSQLPAIVEPGAALFFEGAPNTIGPLAELVAATFPSAAVEIGTDRTDLERYVAVTLATAA